MEHSEIFSVNIQTVLWALILGILLPTLCLKYILSTKNLPPGPWGFPLLGYLPLLGKHPHLTFMELSRKYGPVFRIRMGTRPTVVLCGYDVIREALVEKGQVFAGRPDFESFKYIIDGKSITFQTYRPGWNLLRKTALSILQTFSTNRQTFNTEQVINEQAQKLVENIIEEPNGPVGPMSLITNAVTNVIFAVCFGANVEYHEDSYVKAYLRSNETFHEFQARGGNPGDLMTWAKPFTRSKLKTFIGLMTEQVDSLKPRMEAHQETFQETHIRDVMDACILAAKRLSVAEKAEAGLTDDEILLIPASFIGAGIGTVATSLHWAMVYMACFPEIQRKVQEEIHDIIGTERYVSLADRTDLPYVEACILEILRHSSIAPLSLPHSTKADTYLRGYKIPKDTLVLINLWSVSHDDSVWESPEIFRPERFLLNDGRSLDKSRTETFWPFSLGKRRCIGENLSRTQLFLFFATLMQKCKFSTSPDHPLSLEPEPGLVLQPQKQKIIVQPVDTVQK